MPVVGTIGGPDMGRILFALLLATLTIASVPSDRLSAQQPTAEMQAELGAAWEAAGKTGVRGPGEIKLLDQAVLKLTADQVFIPAAEANRLMKALGNVESPVRHGLIVSTKEDARWLVDLNWIKEGYVRDEEAKDWQADALLASLKEGTEAANEDRVARGFPAMEITGWVEEPIYDPATHRLIWSLASHDRGAVANAPQTINYNTYALGREGYFSLDLITGADQIAADKQVARDLIAALNYVPGKRYQDFDSSTDTVAAYGIGALVGAVAAKKLGLLAIIGLFLAKAWKLVLIGFFAVAAIVRRFFKRGESEADENVAEVGEEAAPEAEVEAPGGETVEDVEASEPDKERQPVDGGAEPRN
jgi:uncharacterized membrane-anchored protein